MIKFFYKFAIATVTLVMAVLTIGRLLLLMDEPSDSLLVLGIVGICAVLLTAAEVIKLLYFAKEKHERTNNRPGSTYFGNAD